MTINDKMMPPEWHPQHAVLLSWPHDGSDWAYMLDEVTECFEHLAIAISRRANLIIVAPDVSVPASQLKGKVDESLVTYVEMPTNDTWARDFGPLCVIGANGSIVANDFKFNGWGLKFAANCDNLITSRLFAAGAFPRYDYSNRLGFVLEGGSVDIDDDGTLITTEECLLSPNRNGDMTKEQIESALISLLGCAKVLWLSHGFLAGDDTDSHVDTLARFLPGKIIACSACDRPEDEHYAELKAMRSELDSFSDTKGNQYQIVELPIPHPIFDEEGLRLPATYANFLLLNGTIFLPIYGDAHYDDIAIKAIGKALPDYEIVTIRCEALIKQHGSLHCVTMQLP